MAKKYKQIARVIQEQAHWKTQIAQLSIRPLRMAFLIDTDTSKDDLQNIITYNTSIWGGFYNLLVPVSESELSEHWWNATVQYDPDVIIVNFVPNDKFTQKLDDEIQPFAIEQWSENAIEQHQENYDKFGNIPIHLILIKHFERIRPIEGSKIRLPKIDRISPFELSAGAQFGITEENNLSLLFDVYKAEEVDLSCKDLNTYLNSILAFRGNFSPLRITRHGIRTQTMQFYQMLLGTTFVLMSEDSFVEDICLFWNWRSTSDTIFAGIKEIILLPFSSLSTEIDYKALGDWYTKQINGTNLITLASSGVPQNELNMARNQLQTYLPKETLIDLWYDSFRFINFQIKHMPTLEELRINGRKYDISIPEPDWSDITNKGIEWVLDIDLSRDSIFEPGEGYIPPKYPELNYLLAGKPLQKWWNFMKPKIRLSHNNLSLRVDRDEKFKSIELPDETSLFTGFLSSKGYSANLTDKCRYAQGMIRLLGGYEEAKVLQDPGIRELFEKMKDGKTTLSIGDMYQPVKNSGNKTKYFESDELNKIISEFTIKGILQRGYQIKCPVCDLSRWYSLKEISERFMCAGCLSNLQPPLQAEFHYRLNELFIRGIDQGAVPLLLSIILLANFSNKSFLFIPGIELSDNNKTVDIDMMCACNGIVTIAECKNLETGLSKNSFNKLKEQLKKTLTVAEKLGGKIFILITLLEHIPEMLDSVIEECQEEYPDIAVHLAIKETLEKGYFYSPGVSGQDKPLMLSDLLPKRYEDKKGRDIPPGERKIGIGGGTWSQTT